MTSEPRSSVAAWKRCSLCVDHAFKTPQDFRLHLRKNHCKKEGGSYVCCYGNNNICGSLPLEGVSDQDYEFHVVKHHVLTFTSKYYPLTLSTNNYEMFFPCHAKHFAYVKFETIRA